MQLTDEGREAGTSWRVVAECANSHPSTHSMASQGAVGCVCVREGRGVCVVRCGAGCSLSLAVVLQLRANFQSLLCSLPTMRHWILHVLLHSHLTDTSSTAAHLCACSLDLATSSKVAGGWYGRLEELAWQNEVRWGVRIGGGGRLREGGSPRGRGWQTGWWGTYLGCCPPPSPALSLSVLPCPHLADKAV